MVLKEVLRVLKLDGEAVLSFNQEKSEVVAEIQKLLLDKEVDRKKELTKEKFEEMVDEVGFSGVDVSSATDTFYYDNLDELIGSPKKAFVSVSEVKHSDDELAMFWKKLKEIFENKKTDSGYPESWNMVFARLIK